MPNSQPDFRNVQIVYIFVNPDEGTIFPGNMDTCKLYHEGCDNFNVGDRYTYRKEGFLYLNTTFPTRGFFIMLYPGEDHPMIPEDDNNRNDENVVYFIDENLL